MTAELIAITAVGVSLAGLILRLNRRIDRLKDRFEDRLVLIEQRFEDRLVAVEQGLAELRERMARVEGLLEGLRDAVVRAAA